MSDTLILLDALTPALQGLLAITAMTAWVVVSVQTLRSTYRRKLYWRYPVAR